MQHVSLTDEEIARLRTLASDALGAGRLEEADRILLLLEAAGDGGAEVLYFHAMVKAQLGDLVRGDALLELAHRAAQHPGHPEAMSTKLQALRAIAEQLVEATRSREAARAVPAFSPLGLRMGKPHPATGRKDP